MSINRLEQLQELLKSEPNDSFLRYAIATEYLKLGNNLKALEFYELVLKDDENYVGTYYHLGKLQEIMDNKDQAIATYKKGMEIARKVGNMHAFSELQSIYNQATGLGDEDDE